MIYKFIFPARAILREREAAQNLRVALPRADSVLLGSAFAQNREPSSMARSRRIATAGLAILREGGAKPYPESRALPEASAMWP